MNFADRFTNFATEFPFLWEMGEPAGLRIARCCQLALGPGPMGDEARPDFYRAFVSCGFYDALSNDYGDGPEAIGDIRTSCAVFARAVLHWCGKRAQKPGKIGWPIMGDGKAEAWLGDLNPRHPAAVWLDKRQMQPIPGMVIYRDYSRDFGRLGHVQVIVREDDAGLFTTAEGGGGDVDIDGDGKIDTGHSGGTVCRLSSKPKDVFAKDSLGRIPIVGWVPDRLGLEGTYP